MSDLYRQTVVVEGDELELIWSHYKATQENPEEWFLLEVDGWDCNSCPSDLWSTCDALFDYDQMTQVVPDIDFEPEDSTLDRWFGVSFTFNPGEK